VSDITRRQLLKLGAAGAGATALTPLANPLGFDLRLAKKREMAFRIAGAKEVHSVCPYCAVGCGLIAYTKQDAGGKTQLLQIEGDPDNPINEGRLCPKGATAMQLATSSRRVEKPLYRAPGSADPSFNPARTLVLVPCSAGARPKNRHDATHNASV